MDCYQFNGFFTQAAWSWEWKGPERESPHVLHDLGTSRTALRQNETPSTGIFELPCASCMALGQVLKLCSSVLSPVKCKWEQQWAHQWLWGVKEVNQVRHPERHLARHSHQHTHNPMQLTDTSSQEDTGALGRYGHKKEWGTDAHARRQLWWMWVNERGRAQKTHFIWFPL